MTTETSSSSGVPLPVSAGLSQPGFFKRIRKLGNNEMFVNVCHSHANLNVMCGLTLLTRHAVDEGLMKCALQEFQHTYPQLTSRIRKDDSSRDLYFIPMECPTLPLDTEFECKDMLHEKFDIQKGPLWRVQLITEATMNKAQLGFGPELAAIISDDSPIETRWRYFLRYFQGNVNGREINKFDEDEEGFRSFILFTFHPSITDTIGVFHLMRQFLYVLDNILDGDEDSSHSLLISPEELHQPVEQLLPQGENSMQFTDLWQFGKVLTSFMVPKKNLFESYGLVKNDVCGSTQVLRGRLDEEQTAELLAMLEEDDVSLHGAILAAGLIAVSRILQAERSQEYPPKDTLSIRATNEANLRQYCESGAKHGCLTTYYEADYEVPSITDRVEFWRFAHELTVKHNSAKGNREPLKLLRIYNRMFSVGGDNVFKDMDKNLKLQNEMGVAVYGDLGSLFRRESQTQAAPNTQSSLDTWSRPLSGTKRNIRLEDVFHMVAAQNMGSPMTHTAHILYGQLNYILLYHTTFIDQSVALKVRDEVVEILRMATEKPEF